MWQNLSPEWQTAFDEAWEAFRKGCIPIGAALFDENGVLLIRDHNRGAEAGTINRLISHAEANTLRRLDTGQYNVRDLVLYTTMEPCPMCMGTIVMSNIRHIRYAARDPHCGSVHWNDDDPYIRGKQIEHILEGGEAEFVQLCIQSYYELRGAEQGRGDDILRKFGKINAGAVAAARALYRDKALDAFAESGIPFSQVYDEIIRSGGSKTEK